MIMLRLILLLGSVGSCWAQKQLLVFPRIVEERTAMGNFVLRINDEITLNLEGSRVLADNLLFVTKQHDGHRYKMIDTARIQEHLYYDSHQQSSVFVTHEDGALLVKGIINHKLRIKPLLESERSSDGRVLHSIFEAEEIWTSYKDALPYKSTMSTTRQNRIYTPRFVREFVVEVHIISDERHQKYFRRDIDLIEYLSIMLNAVNRIFVDMTGPAISFKLVGITRSRNDTFTSPFLDTVVAHETLERLVDYTSANSILKHSDLVYLITGANLASLRNGMKLERGVAGLAYVGEVCTPNAVAEGEDIPKSYAGVHTMAHELAHSLGASHDPQDDSECSWKKGFLLSYEDKGSNKYRLSRCSEVSITDVVQRLSDECLKESGNQTLHVDHTKMPGDMVVRHYYCKKMLQRISRRYFLFKQDPHNKCKLQCYYHKQNRTSLETWFITVDMAEGMWCGDEKTCQRGICTEAPPTKTPHG
ncbi:venom metalloproteinase antarease-like TtrivMP_A isoform X2 [Rhipicephalus microplus]|uniref:venom metalloproteinase antarease-like TtrivMP_A isoform X2 n=1 Tax=Rhipicephalus microplus TaxID=6941 RepID=UPI003F6DA067